MGLTFKARVLLELGAELISSDGVALYELIKNGLDAGSEDISIQIQVVMQASTKRAILRRWRDSTVKWDPDKFLEEVESGIDSTASDPARTEFLASVSTESRTKALTALEDACIEFNFIEVVDSGTGMNADTLDQCYLTIGTTNRLFEKKAAVEGNTDGARVPLGEKGIGRLAAMRLGHYVRVVSCVANEPNEFTLDLDWRPVYANPALELHDKTLQFEPKLGGPKTKLKGTTILIKDLQSDWDLDKLRELSSFDLEKLADPFKSATASQFLNVKFQGANTKQIGVFEAARLKAADAVCHIKFRSGPIGSENPVEQIAVLEVNTSYRLYNRDEKLVHAGAHLATVVSHVPRKSGRSPKAADKLPRSDEVVAALETLGDFEAQFWWFNRGRLIRDEKTLWTGGLGDFVRKWSGGLLVYRDGYRVYPYGSAQDDWLDLDRKALASSAYKLNRAQIVGYLRITSKENPKLLDQTNREGFRDAPEKEALRRLLRQAIIADCKSFLEKVDKENKVADEETLQDIDARIGDASFSAAQNLKQLKARVPAESATIQTVLQELGEVQDAWNRAKEALKAKDNEVETYTHLAGVGLMVELLAHELARTTQDALDLLADKKTPTDPARLQALAAVLKTLNKRIRVIDFLSIPGRQRKQNLSIPSLVDEMGDFYSTKFDRHQINFVVKQVGDSSFIRKVEKGQILQILDNLFNNSVFWLARRLKRLEPPQINVEIDGAKGTVTVTDNGPGISEEVGSRVFDAFYTSKGETGRGLGLYIASKLATENDAQLELLPPKDGIHPGFRLRF